MTERSILELVRLPARMNFAQAGDFLGYTEVEIRILVKSGLLRCAGRPPANGHKFLLTVELERLSRDKDWLEKASRCVYRHWSERNGKQQTSESIDSHRVVSSQAI